MKKMLCLLAVLTAGCYAFNPAALARELDDDGDSPDADHWPCQRTNVNGAEHFTATVALQATTNAPDGAAGTAVIRSVSNDGWQHAALFLSVTNLPAADYRLGVVMLSDGTNIDLGTVTVGGHCGGDDGDDWANTGSWHPGDGENDDDEGDGEDGPDGAIRVRLPSDLNVMDIAQVVLADLDGNPLLVGNLTNPAPATTMQLQAQVSVQAGSAAPGATGSATLSAAIKKGRRVEKFKMTATGLPGATRYTAFVNGQQVRTLKSNRKGALVISKLPGKSRYVHTVRLVNPQGDTALTVRF